jgi:hypothetical protein
MILVGGDVLKNIIVIVFALWFSLVQAIADPRVEEAIKLSNLAHSALECSQLTTNPNEQKRLFDIGMTTGEEFFSLFEKLNNEEIEEAEFKMNIDWIFPIHASGNSDFRLGVLWSAIKFDRELDFSREDEKWKREHDYDREKIQMEAMFNGKNCTYIH